MKYSLDQRLYNMNITKKDLQKECVKRGRNISYSSVCKVINEPEEVLYSTEKKVIETVEELEHERGIA